MSRKFLFVLLMSMTCVLGTSAQDAHAAGRAPDARRLQMGGVQFVHHESEPGQHEYLADGQDPDDWHDMLTIVERPEAPSPETLAAVAESVVERYKSMGLVPQNHYVRVSEDAPLGYYVMSGRTGGGVSEVSFTHLRERDGRLYMVIRSHREAGTDALHPMEVLSPWIETHLPVVVPALLGWEGLPSPESLRQLPLAH